MARPEEPAWAGKENPNRPRPQTRREMLMPCTQFEAFERRQQARRDRGVDSDELTVQDEDEDKDGNDDLQEDAVPLEARICTTTVDMFKRVLLFSQGAAEALYNDQMVTTLDRGSGPFVPSIFFFFARPFFLFFSFWRESRTPKATQRQQKQTDAEQREALFLPR
jgi:hypothetical protein